MFRRPVLVSTALVAVLVLGSSLLACDAGDDSAVPARYAATIDFQGMAPHVGQMLELRVVHGSTGVEVAYWRVPWVVTPNFVVTAADCLIVGESYYVDFYADLNGNGHYDTPPTDHAWRRWIGPVTGPMVLSFTHDTIWTDIDFPAHP